MALFDEIGKKLSDASQSVAQKGKEMSDSLRINSLISDEEKKISALYAEIGKTYVSLCDGRYEEELKPQIESLQASQKRIEELKIQLQEVKSTVKCSACGAENPKTAQFCASCGKPLKSETTVEEAKPIKICANCGAELAEGLRFCTSCGHAVEE